jgi:hypothetical protein
MLSSSIGSAGRHAIWALLGLLVFAPIGFADEPPGVRWETTSQPVLQGMPGSIPAQKSDLCTPRVWTRPPPGGDQTCKNSNFRMVDNKASWDVVCTGDMPMTGAGEILFEGSDSYTGTVRLTSEMMSMTINLTGKKVGTCDKPIQ